MKKEIKILYLFIGTFLILSVLVVILQSITGGIFFENITGQSPLDIFSLGHLFFGILVCSLFLLILNRKKRDILLVIVLSLTITFIISIGFEIFENSSLIVNSGLKYNDSADSTINMTTDIILNMLGAILMCYIYWKLFNKSKKRVITTKKWQKIGE